MKAKKVILFICAGLVLSIPGVVAYANDSNWRAVMFGSMVGYFVGCVVTYFSLNDEV